MTTATRTLIKSSGVKTNMVPPAEIKQGDHKAALEIVLQTTEY
jgi:hypothetical protein